VKVDEREWLERRTKLSSLQQQGKLSKRKARLLACAAIRRIWHLLTDPRSRKAVKVTESHADGMASDGELMAARKAAFAASTPEHAPTGKMQAREAKQAANVASWVTLADNDLEVVFWALEQVPTAIRDALISDLFGNPFDPVAVDPSLLTWHDGLIRHLAQAAYDERQLPSGHLDPHRLAVLADALEEAGCTDLEILGHLRQPGAVHVRGCWPVDLPPFQGVTG
jgi:hypothetical protein